MDDPSTDDPSTDDPSTDDPSTDDEWATAPEWHALALVIAKTDITWTDSSGAEHRQETALTPGELAAATSALENVPNLFFAWSDGMGWMNLEVRVVEDTVTSMSQIGEDSFWVGPADVADLLEANVPPHTFDSIFVVFDHDGGGPVDLPIHAFYGMGVGEGTHGATFASLMTGDEPSDDPNRGEVYIHEWLHGANAWYREHGYPVPDPHENDRFGFPAADENGSWGAWYAALMRGGLIDPDTGARAGITAITWLSETPRSAGVKPIVRAANMVDADWLYVEWDPVADTELYTIFAATKAGPFVSKVEAGASDRGPFRYTYFRRSDICAAAPAGEHELWVQIWPDDDSSRAVSRDAAGTITCP